MATNFAPEVAAEPETSHPRPERSREGLQSGLLDLVLTHVEINRPRSLDAGDRQSAGRAD